MKKTSTFALLAALLAVSAPVHAEETSVLDKVLDMFAGGNDQKSDTKKEEEKKTDEKKSETKTDDASDAKKEEEKKDEAQKDETSDANKESDAAKEEAKKEEPKAAQEKKPEDLSKIEDPKVRVHAEEYQKRVKACGSDADCILDARTRLKANIRPLVARKSLYKHIALFDEADQAFRTPSVFRQCFNALSGFIPRCEGNEGCQEVLYYSFHNNCGKRLFQKGYVKKRSSTVEKLAIKSTAQAPSVKDGTPTPVEKKKDDAKPAEEKKAEDKSAEAEKPAEEKKDEAK